MAGLERYETFHAEGRKEQLEGGPSAPNQYGELVSPARKEKPRGAATRLRGLFEHPGSPGSAGLEVGGHKRLPLPAEMSAF
jgi:hypothetical protein